MSVGAAVLALTLDRFFKQRDEEKNNKASIEKIKTLVASELKNIAHNVLDAHTHLKAAYGAVRHGGPASGLRSDLLLISLSTPSLDRLLEKVLTLSPSEIEAISALKYTLDDVKKGFAKVDETGWLSIERTLSTVQECMIHLIDIFEKISPDTTLYNIEKEQHRKIIEILMEKLRELP